MTGEYGRLGVSAAKDDVRSALRRIDKGLFPTAFCKIVADILSGSPDHCVILHADGAGTKSSLAYLHYWRHNDPAIFRGLAQDALVMNIDDVICVGGTGPFLFSNTIGRNAGLITSDILRVIIEGYEDIISTLADHGIQISSCGGETADIGDLVRTIVVDATVATRMRRDLVIDATTIKPGQDIVGLASYGQARYETQYNSGIGANGLTLARHRLLASHFKHGVQESYDPSISAFAYRGRWDIDDVLPGTDLTIASALLSPTRTYAPIICRILDIHDRRISAICHNTGGGQTKCLRLGRGVRYVKDNLFPMPPIFKLIESECGVTFKELAGTFNLGHRMEIICEPSLSSEAIDIAHSFNVEAKVVGRTETGPDIPTLIISHEGEEFRFDGFAVTRAPDG